MADNVVLNAGTGGDTSAADDVGGAKYQRVKLSLGADGTASDAPVGGGVESGSLRVTIASDSTGVLSVDDNGGSITVDGTVTINPIPAGTNNIGDVDVLTVPTDPFGANADAASATGSISAKLRFIAGTGIPVTSLPTLANVTTVGTVTTVTTLSGTTSLTPGTGATNLGKAEDAAHSTGDVGVMALAVRNDAGTALAGTTGDYIPLSTDSSGALRVVGSSGTTQYAEDAAHASGDSGVVMLAVRRDTASSGVSADGDYAVPSVDSNGYLRVRVDGGSVAGVLEDGASAGGEEGVLMMGVRQDTLASSTSADGDYTYPKFNAQGALYVAGSFTGTAGAVSTANSTSSNLTSGSTFTGTSEETTNYAAIMVNVLSSHASAANGLSLQQSSDGTNWDHTDTFTVSASTSLLVQVPTQARYFRLVYTNGGTGTTSLRIQTIFKPNAPRGSSQRPADAISNENDFEQVMGFNMLYNGTTWDRVRGDTTNGVDVDVTRVPTDPFGANADAASSTGSISAKLRFIAATGIPVTALPASTNTIEVVGDVAQDAAIAGNPLNMGARASTATPTAMSADGDSVYAWADRNGALVVAGRHVDDAAFTPATDRVVVIGLQADETSTDSVDEGDAGAPRMTLDRKIIVTQQPHTQGGLNTAAGSITTTVTSVKASAGQLYGYYIYNPNASAAYCQIFDLATGSVTLGTTTPKLSFGIPATSAANVTFPSGVAFATAISIAFTTTRTGSTAPGSSVDYNFYHF